MSEKKKLPLLAAAKGLMPEVLPAPPTRTGASPRERVLARLRQITGQTAALAAAASLSASDGCGYAVVDPLPMPASGAGGGRTGPWGTAVPPAGASGAAAGSSGVGVPAAGSSGVGVPAAGSAGQPKPPLGVAGYGVVDPVPNPARCDDPAMLEVRVQRAEWRASGVYVSFQTPVQSPGYLKTASAPPPTTVTITSIYELTVETSTIWPASVSIDLGIECLMGTSLATVHVTLKLDTSMPGSSTPVPAQILRQ